MSPRLSPASLVLLGLISLVRKSIVTGSSTSTTVIELPALDYGQDELEPYISAETVSFHYGAHHQGYVNNLNAIIEASPSDYAGKSLYDIMLSSTDTTFNNAAQIYNHNVYWKSLSPAGGGDPTGTKVGDAIVAAYGSYDNFKTDFNSIASSHFGSGWAWLVMHDDMSVEVVDTHDATNPPSEGLGYPLLVCDVWEHAYYIDYRNARSDYLDNWWNLVNWDYANEKYLEYVQK